MLEYIAPLNGVLPPQRIETLVKIEKVFNMLGYTDHEAQVINAFSNPDLDNLTKALAVQGAYETQMDHMFLLLGIYLVDDEDLVNLKFKAHLLENIFMAESIDNLDVLVKVCQGYADVEGVDFISALLQELTGKPDAFYEIRIADVDSALVRKLKMLSTVPEATEHLQEQVKAIRLEFLIFYGDAQGPMRELVIERGVLPLPYLDVAARLHAEAEDLSDKDLAFEVYGGLILADIDKGARYGIAQTLITELSQGTPREYTLPAAFEDLFNNMDKEDG